jgi:hypothetical protein
LEDPFGSLFVEFVVRGEYEKVVHVDDEPSFGNHVSERVIHETLEGCWEVGKSKKHYHGFEEAFVGDESGLPLMSVFDSDIIVPPSDVELGECFGIPEFVDEVGDERKGVGVADHVFINVTVVLAGSESSIIFLDKEERGGLGGIRWADLSGC